MSQMCDSHAQRARLESSGCKYRKPIQWELYGISTVRLLSLEEASARHQWLLWKTCICKVALWPCNNSNLSHLLLMVSNNDTKIGREEGLKLFTHGLM